MANILDQLNKIEERVTYLETVKEAVKDYLLACKTAEEAGNQLNREHTRNQQLAYDYLVELIPIDK